MQSEPTEAESKKLSISENVGTGVRRLNFVLRATDEERAAEKDVSVLRLSHYENRQTLDSANEERKKL